MLLRNDNVKHQFLSFVKTQYTGCFHADMVVESHRKINFHLKSLHHKVITFQGNTNWRLEREGERERGVYGEGRVQRGLLMGPPHQATRPRKMGWRRYGRSSWVRSGSAPITWSTKNYIWVPFTRMLVFMREGKWWHCG